MQPPAGSVGGATGGGLGGETPRKIFAKIKYLSAFLAMGIKWLSIQTTYLFKHNTANAKQPSPQYLVPALLVILYQVVVQDVQSNCRSNHQTCNAYVSLVTSQI